jgi:hypothetical protein
VIHPAVPRGTSSRHSALARHGGTWPPLDEPLEGHRTLPWATIAVRSLRDQIGGGQRRSVSCRRPTGEPGPPSTPYHRGCGDQVGHSAPPAEPVSGIGVSHLAKRGRRAVPWLRDSRQGRGTSPTLSRRWPQNRGFLEGTPLRRGKRSGQVCTWRSTRYSNSSCTTSAGSSPTCWRFSGGHRPSS